ncbi:MAG: signal peptide peptidase SppA [Capnocytophaga sp.]|nr:signal peptide peptidase SppA [Capnocytophaga sp.]
MNFLKNVLAAILGFFISLGILFALFLLLISAFSSVLGESSQKSLQVKDNSVLVLDFKKPLQDYGNRTYFEDFDYTSEEFNGLNVILKAIEIAKTDDNIKGISIKSTGNVQGIAIAKALRSALADFKESGKFIYAFNDAISQTDYYVQSVADSIFVSPLAEITFRGLSSEILFFKKAQEKTGITMEVIRHGKYKSAVEPFLENSMSEANREQMSELLHSLWSGIVTDIAQSRHLSVDTLNSIANTLSARTPALALQAKLIDAVIYQDQFDELLVKRTAVDSFEDVRFIGIENYAQSVTGKASLNRPKDKIAVIYAEGEIVYGQGAAGIIGNETIAKALHDAREDDDIKAVVLRINSPGGSALSSELMHREIELTKARKNVYVSMGNYAASGGYYIACNADKIYAEAGTITGSIGVFGVLPNVQKLADKWGINAEQVQTHDHAMGYSPFEAPTPNFIKVTTESVENIYNVFVERVAKGRSMSTSEVEAIAQGRVWSGVEAQRIGLVDEIGGLNDAILYAAQENDLEKYDLKTYPIYKTSFKELFESFGVKAKQQALQQEIGDDAYEIYQNIKSLANTKGVQARMYWNIRID